MARFWERGLWGALLAQFNEHRFFIPGIFYWADFRFFGGRNLLLAGASAAIHVAGIIVLALPLIRNREVPPPVAAVFSGFVTITMLWYIQGPNFFYPYNLCIPLANLEILLSLFSLAAFLRTESRFQSSRVWLLAASIVCGFAATFTYGNGMLIWPLLLGNALLARLPVRRIIPIAAAALLALGLYFRHYLSPPGHTNPFESLRHPLKLATYFFVMIGLPLLGGEGATLEFPTKAFQYLLILSGLLSAVAFLFIWVRRSHEVFYSSLLLFAVGSAAITALSRSNFPVSQALSARYAPIPLLFWISLIALITLHLCRPKSKAGAALFFWCTGLAAASFATLPAQSAMGSYFATRARFQQSAVASIALGIPDTAAVSTELYPQIALLQFVDRRTMEAYRRSSFFAMPETRLIGTALQPRFTISGDCQSRMDDPLVYQSGQNRAVRLSGWLYDTNRRQCARRILVTDAAGTILGFGIGQMPRPGVAAAFRNPAMYASGWIAYAHLPSGESRPLRIFGLPAGSSAVCEVRSPNSSGSPPAGTHRPAVNLDSAVIGTHEH